MDGYRRNSHVKFALKVHIILVSKYRKKLFNNKRIDNDVKQFIYESVRKKKSHIIQMETDKDHIHILLEYNSRQSISNIVQNIKQHTTHKMWNYHTKTLSELYWKKNVLWSDGYFACSIGQVLQDILEKYIQNQGIIPPCIPPLKEWVLRRIFL